MLNEDSAVTHYSHFDELFNIGASNRDILPIFTALGESINLNGKDGRPYHKAFKWLLQCKSEDYYKCRLGHCNHQIHQQEDPSLEFDFSLYFDLENHRTYGGREYQNNFETYADLRDYLMRLRLKEQTGEEHSAGLRDFYGIDNDPTDERRLSLMPEISTYLKEQVLIDYAYYITGGYQAKTFYLKEYERDELIKISKSRNERRQPMSYGLETFLVNNIKENRLARQIKKPRIGASHDYRIMYMTFKEARKNKIDRKSVRTLKNGSDKTNIFKKVCETINKWNYFMDVTPTKNGSSEDRALSSVWDRYYAKHSY